jgi:hypothetical protein
LELKGVKEHFRVLYGPESLYNQEIERENDYIDNYVAKLYLKILEHRKDDASEEIEWFSAQGKKSA